MDTIHLQILKLKSENRVINPESKNIPANTEKLFLDLESNFEPVPKESLELKGNLKGGIYLSYAITVKDIYRFRTNGLQNLALSSKFSYMYCNKCHKRNNLSVKHCRKCKSKYFHTALGERIPSLGEYERIKMKISRPTYWKSYKKSYNRI